MSWTDELRAKYMPSQVKVLFVGEAPPAAGTFFYAGNSQVYRYLREMLLSRFGGSDDFLAAFATHGYYLDDLVTDPVDHIPLPDRRPIFKQSVPLLAERMAAMQPKAIVTILMRIADYAEDARKLAGLDVPHYRVPFPGTGQQGNFRRRMAEIIPLLP